MEETENEKKRGALRQTVAARYRFRRDPAGGARIVLEGQRRAVLYGCRKILSYSEEQIVLSLGRKSVSLCGKRLYCVSFSAGTVTVEGEIDGVLYGEPSGKGIDA